MPQDKELSKFEQLKKSTEQGNITDYFNLANCYFYGEEGICKKDYIQAIKWFEKCTCIWSHQLKAQYNMATCYFEGGNGIQQDSDKAIGYLEKAAEQKYVQAQLKLVDCYFEGMYGVPQDDSKGIEWLKKAAKFDKTPSLCLHRGEREGTFDYTGGDCSAQLRLALLYYFGKRGVEKNDEQAFENFKAAAQIENSIGLPKTEMQLVSTAQAALGICYYYGYGVEKNDELALEYFEESSKQNNSFGYLWLAYLTYLKNKPAAKVDTNEIERHNQLKAIVGNIEANEDKIDKYLCMTAVNLFLQGENSHYNKHIDTINFAFSDNEIIPFLENSEYPPARVILAFYHQCKNEKEKSLALLNEAASKNDILAYYLLGMHYKGTDFDKAKEYFDKVEKYKEQSTYEKDTVTILRISSQNEIISHQNKALESEIKQKESLQNRMQKLVEQFTHSLGNVIFPDTIYQVAERLKNLPECRRDTLLLHEAYHAEIIIKLQAELLRHRYGNKEPESFRNMIRKCRRNANSSDKIKSIEDILNYAVSRATARFLNQHYAGLETIRNKILSQHNTELNQLKQKFEDDILLHNCLSPMEWVSQNLRPIQITQISPLWKKIFILADSYAEALLFGYFSEILFNALKYADHDNKEFLTLSFTETNINDNVYLLSNWSNPTIKQKLPELGTNKGLEAIAEDLKQLNDTEKPEQSLLISQQANRFQVTLFFKKDLLVNDLPILKIKRPVKVAE